MKLLSILLAATVLTGCAVAPDTIVQKPLTARPEAPVPAATVSNGAIFQSASYRPLFEDRRARMVGDTLLIVINEKTSASKAGGNNGSKTNSADASVGSLFGVSPSVLARLGAQAESSINYDEKSTGSASNNFIGSLTVTVIEVLPNGNLVVAGEKQVALDRGSEFIRFSGVVNPNQVAGNSISSTQVADARIEYRTNAHIDKAQVYSTLARFFLSVLPL